MSTPKKEEIKFPCRWEFRAIAVAEQKELARAAVTRIGSEHGKCFEIIAGECSKGGKYAALRIACEVISIEEARSIAGDLAKAEGVRFLL